MSRQEYARHGSEAMIAVRIVHDPLVLFLMTILSVRVKGFGTKDVGHIQFQSAVAMALELGVMYKQLTKFMHSCSMMDSTLATLRLLVVVVGPQQVLVLAPISMPSISHTLHLYPFERLKYLFMRT